MAVSSSRLSATHRREIDLTDDQVVDTREVHAHDTEFARLYDEFSLRVIGLVRRFISDEDLVDDLVQETFLRAYNGGLHLEYLDADRERDQWPWLAAVARNLSLDAIRKRRGAFEDELNDEVVEQIEEVDDPEVQLLASRRREGIAEALEDLCPRQRRMLILKHVNGWAYTDIAEREGISVEALKSALARARRTFRAAYDNIAERSGLGVVLGGLLTRLPGKLRDMRNRVMTAPDAASAVAAVSPGLANTVATAAVLGAVGAAGVLGGSPAGATSEPTTPVAVVVEPPVEEPSEPVAPDSAFRVSVESEVDAKSADPVEDTTPSGEAAPAMRTIEHDSSVGTDDVAPAGEAPANADASSNARIEEDVDGSTVAKAEQSVGIDATTAPLVNEIDEDETQVENDAYAGWDCPPPDRQSTTESMFCEAMADDGNAT